MNEDSNGHPELLDNDAANKALAKAAIERAVADGMDRKLAEQLFGL